MDHDGDSDFERRLLGLELRRPPSEWKALLLPKAMPPLFPGPFLAGVALCWAGTLGFFLATPLNEVLDAPVLPPSEPSLEREALLVWQPNDQNLR